MNEFDPTVPTPGDGEAETLESSVGELAVQVEGYRVLRRVGAGGMGEVYEAEQLEPVRRTVALKVIKWGMDTKEVIGRFESERQALALMSHPAIAAVYGAGATVRGRPYFAMEFVQGVPLTEYCDRHRLSTRERLELFARVCEGVQHAHQKGIIHRDLKPSNVLVMVQAEEPVPKIIDFGLAKATAQRLTERTVFTEYGRLIGTPEYMSPEQAEMTSLDVDTRTDIYSLGVLLYELLVGALPFESQDLRQAGFDEIQRRIREEVPPKPSSRLSRLGERSASAAEQRRTDPRRLMRRLRGDLDWIVMKAIEKDRTRRYQTAHDLALDIGRHLHHEPVRASPPSMAYRGRKFVHRHRPAVIAAGLVLVALLGGLALATFGFVQASRERDASEAVTGFLADMLAAVDPQQAGKDVPMRVVLDAASERIGPEFAAQPLIEARLRSTIGETYRSLGLYDEAEPHLQRALETRRELLGEAHPQTARAMLELGTLFTHQGRYEDALPLYERARVLLMDSLGEEHPDTLTVADKLAVLYKNQGRHDDALSLLNPNLEIQMRTLGEEDNRTLTTMNNLATVYDDQGHFELAEPLYRHTLDIRLRVLGEEHPHTLISMSNLAQLHVVQKRFDLAEPLYVRSTGIKRRILGEEHPSTLISLSNLAFFYLSLERYEDAEPLYLKVLEVRRRTLGVEHPSTIISLGSLGNLYIRLERYAEAEPLLAEAVAGARKSLPPIHETTGWALQGYGSCLVGLGRFPAAEGALLEAYEILVQSSGAESRYTQRALTGLGDLYDAWGKHEKAAEYRKLLPDTTATR